MWSASCPENFAGKHALIAAEIARLEARDRDAMWLYEEAVKAARQGRLVQDEAIAYETAARFYRDKGSEILANTYLREARNCYARWGANGKVRQLEGLFPEHFAEAPAERSTTIAARVEQLDLLSVVKASRTISSEIVFEKLIRKLMEVVIEEGGAHKGYLLLARDGELHVEVEALVGDDGIETTLLGEPLRATELLPMSLVQSVWRTGQRAVIGDATKLASIGELSSDKYLVRTRAKSVLCVPS